jgi:hypothetical protein
VVRLPLSRAFIKAIRASACNQVVLASVAGFASPTQLSKVIHGRVLPTPLVVERLSKLADFVQYTGDLFMVRK